MSYFQKSRKWLVFSEQLPLNQSPCPKSQGAWLLRELMDGGLQFLLPDPKVQCVFTGRLTDHGCGHVCSLGIMGFFL